jgi:hypothetical protein
LFEDEDEDEGRGRGCRGPLRPRCLLGQRGIFPNAEKKRTQSRGIEVLAKSQPLAAGEHAAPWHLCVLFTSALSETCPDAQRRLDCEITVPLAEK